MPHRNTVFHDALKLVPWAVFDRLVEEHGADKLVRRFTTRHQLLALMFGQLAGVSSLRDIGLAMESHKARLYHAGAQVPQRSTLSDANALRSSQVFSGLFDAMLAGTGRGVRRHLGEAVRLIDSTSLRLAGIGADWARFSSEVCGAKAHVIFDPDAGVPVYHAVTAAKTNDITAAKAMPVEPGATYVFDLGYYDYSWWARLDEAGCRIVTRFKANTPLNDPRPLPLAPGTRVLSDAIGFLPARQARSRKNPMSGPVREITVRTETGKLLRLLSNDIDAPADEIADLYKRRWQIELFFRLIKQTLRITHFFGRSDNAVRIQIAVALIVFLILHKLQQITPTPTTFLEIVRLVRTNLMHRKIITNLKAICRPPPSDLRQLPLDLVCK